MTEIEISPEAELDMFLAAVVEHIEPDADDPYPTPDDPLADIGLNETGDLLCIAFGIQKKCKIHVDYRKLINALINRAQHRLNMDPKKKRATIEDVLRTLTLRDFANVVFPQ